MRSALFACGQASEHAVRPSFKERMLANRGRRRGGKILALALFTWAVLSAAALAPQPTSPFESAEVHLWPEYDRMAVLVIYRITLPTAASLPTIVDVPIPALAGEPYAVAVRDSEGELLNAAYTRVVDGDWATIAVEATERDVQLEYYEDLIRDGPERHYTFTWPVGLPTASLAFEVQQPVGATEFELDPPGAAPRAGELGLLYHRIEIGAVTGSPPPTLSLRYQKASEELSIEAAPVSLPSAAGSSSAGLGAWAPWVLGGLGVVLVAAGGVWQVRRMRAQRPSRNRHRTARRPEEGTRSGEAEVFCHSCGTPAGLSDRFCRQCGTRLRR
ncbi:MAG: hypothetical protein ACRDG5_07675 [Anaerolineales bacterium]